tara:strand:- start:73 stop:447 length:375 start_codon:yes stop_codon:yes gene_type:complete
MTLFKMRFLTVFSVASMFAIAFVNVNSGDMAFAGKVSLAPFLVATLLSFIFKLHVNKEKSWRREVFIICASSLGTVLLIKLNGITNIDIPSMLLGIAIQIPFLTMLLNMVEYTIEGFARESCYK